MTPYSPPPLYTAYVYDFALDGTRIAKDRVTLPVEMGGLGLFDVEKFLVSQQAGWVFKALKSSRDN
jgi:hypothetical protein